MVEFVLAAAGLVAVGVAVKKHLNLTVAKAEVVKVKASIAAEIAKVAPTASADVAALVAKIKAIL